MHNQLMIFEICTFINGFCTKISIENLSNKMLPESKVSWAPLTRECIGGGGYFNYCPAALN